jgi:Family of unknown function (DUF5985)
MAETIYVLCGLTSVACALLLLRGYQRTEVRLLFWSGLCFVGLALNNGLVLADLVAFPDIDFSLSRSLAALGATGLLVFGLVWDTE